MEKLSKQTFELLCFIKNHKTNARYKVLQDFNAEVDVTRLRIDELIRLNLLQQRGYKLLLTTEGKKLIADTLDAQTEEKDKRHSSFRFDIVSSVLGGVIVFLIEKILSN